MSKMYLFIAALAVVLLTFGFAANAQADLINGNFEDTDPWGAVGSTDFPDGWKAVDYGAFRNPAVIQKSPSPVIGGSVSAYMPAGAGANPYELIRQYLVADDQISDWVFECDFASNDPGGAVTASDHSFKLTFTLGGTGTTYQRFIARIVDADNDGDGDLEIYKIGSSWQSVLKDCVQFDADVTSSISVHHLKIVGDMDKASPTYDVYVTDSLGTTRSALGVGNWYSQVPAQNAALTGVQFDTGDSVGGYLIDNVTVHSAIPEPSTLALLACGLLGLLAYAWRKRK